MGLGTDYTTHKSIGNFSGILLLLCGSPACLFLKEFIFRGPDLPPVSCTPFQKFEFKHVYCELV